MLLHSTAVVNGEGAGAASGGKAQRRRLASNAGAPRVEGRARRQGNGSGHGGLAAPPGHKVLMGG